MDFLTLPTAGRVRLDNLVTPGVFRAVPDAEFVPVTLTLADGAVVDGPAERTLDMGGRILLPCGVDMHTHLDKGHIWPRKPNPDGTFMGALTAVGEDRVAHWTAEDVRARMAFSIRCAYAHGTRAIRTHLDSIPPQDAISWPVFAELRSDWAGRVELQAVNLVALDHVSADGPFVGTADIVKAHGGVLGCVAYPMPDLEARLDLFLAMAAARGLAVDFHVDESLDPDSRCLAAIARAVLRARFDAPVVVGHCCSVAMQGDADETLDLVAEAGLNVVSLPMCNLYLQHRRPGQTPRYRGITLVHEMRDRGIPVAFASDNTRDPFYAYGDMDLIEVLREAVRIGHLDHSRADWAASVSAVPKAICGFAEAAPADFIILNARSWTEAFARPQADRIVVRAGKQIDRALPGYDALDHLMGVAGAAQPIAAKG